MRNVLSWQLLNRLTRSVLVECVRYSYRYPELLSHCPLHILAAVVWHTGTALLDLHSEEYGSNLDKIRLGALAFAEGTTTR